MVFLIESSSDKINVNNAKESFRRVRKHKNMSYKYNFSLAVFKSRKEKGFTQEQAAEKLGISKRWFQKIEKGEKLPSPTLLLKIITVFEIDVRSICQSR